MHDARVGWDSSKLDGNAPSWMPLRCASTMRNCLVSGFRYCISSHNQRRRIPFGSFSSPPLVHFTTVRSSNAEISSACACNGFMIKRLNSACETAFSNRMWVRTVSIGIVVLLYGPVGNVPRAHSEIVPPSLPSGLSNRWKVPP